MEFVNKDVGKYKNADLMSSFCDRILKKGGEKLSDEEVEDTLEKASASCVISCVYICVVHGARGYMCGRGCVMPCALFVVGLGMPRARVPDA